MTVSSEARRVIDKKSRRAARHLRMILRPTKLRILLLAGFGLIFFSTVIFVSYLNFAPSESPDRRKLAVIVPFRDRLEELLEFVPHMSRFLGAQGIPHQFYVINQGDRFRFNRGSLINVGFKLSKDECDYMVMHDVDLLPLNPRLDYGFPARDVVVHIAAPNLHPKYHYDKFVGGILLMRHETFEKADGLSNKYWGWGLEDDEFYVRIAEAGLSLKRPGDIGSGINDTFRDTHDSRKRPRDMLRIGDQRVESRKRDRLTGVHNVDYTVVSKHLVVIDGSAIDIYNVHINCDLSLTPWCEKPRTKKKNN